MAACTRHFFFFSAGAIALSLTLSTASAVPVLEYSFPASWDGVAATVTDLSAAGNDANLAGSPILSATIPPTAPGATQSLDAHEGGFQTQNIDLLENALVEAAGGFRFDASFMWDGTNDEGAPSIQKIIDYAGTEFIQIDTLDLGAGTADLRFGFNDDDAASVVAPIVANEWYDVTAIFDTLGNSLYDSGDANSPNDLDIDGEASLWVNGNLIGTLAVTKTGWGDSLDRSIGIGTFSVLGGIIELAGVIYDPIVQLGTGVTFLEGDFNEDGSVDGNDFLIWQGGFGIPSGAERIDGDANGDGAVDGNDFLIWQTQFGSAEGGAATVPEPATFLLLSIALGCLAALRFRTRVRSCQ